MTDDVIPAAVADRYEACMAVIEERGQVAIAATMEMWNALLEIYSRKLWRARFNTTDEWIIYVSDMGYTGLSRSNVYSKLVKMQNLMAGGVSQEIAAAAVTAVPGAVGMIDSPAELKMVVGDGDPNEYVKQLAFMTPGEAIKKTRLDKGQTVEMWLKELRVGVRPGEAVGLIVRSDGQRGYTAYDVHITVEPQITGNRDMVKVVTEWLIDKVGGHSDRARTR